MRIAVVQFPGSNCERETILALKRAGMEPVEFLWNESPTVLAACEGYVIVGGFSYEDRSRAGIIAALDPVMQVIAAESAQGKPVLGICNGAQILVETGLVPGLLHNKLALALTENKRQMRLPNGQEKILGTGYYNTWVHLRLAEDYQRNAFTRHLHADTVLRIPIAHAEGRFIMTPALLQEVKVQGLAVLQYCDAAGNVIDSFPTNPNGSLANIAAISNKAGNVMAIMPHPERTTAGDVIFRSMRDYIAERKTSQPVIPLHYYPRPPTLPSFVKSQDAHEVIVEMMITDNHALTVEQTLRQRGIPVKVRRQIHWEVICDTPATLEAMIESGLLYNPRKEKIVQAAPGFLVRAHEELVGEAVLQSLQDHVGISGIARIWHSILWHFQFENGNIPPDLRQIDEILNTNIIFNPYAHDCYRYQ